MLLSLGVLTIVSGGYVEPTPRVAAGVSLVLRSQSTFPSPNTIFSSGLCAESVWAASSRLLRPRRKLLSHSKLEKTLIFGAGIGGERSTSQIVHLVVARDPMGYAARLLHGFCMGKPG